jgi:hypothetical protein
MKTLLLILTILTAALPARAEEAPHEAPHEALHERPEFFKWKPPTGLEYSLLILTETMIVADVALTLQFRSHGVPETNPLLGRYPGPTRVILQGGLLPMAALAGVWYVSPPRVRTILMLFTISGEAMALDANIRGIGNWAHLPE